MVDLHHWQLDGSAPKTLMPLQLRDYARPSGSYKITLSVCPEV